MATLLLRETEARFEKCFESDYSVDVDPIFGFYVAWNCIRPVGSVIREDA